MDRRRSRSLFYFITVGIFSFLILLFGTSPGAITGKKVIIIEMDGSINPGTAYFMVRSIEDAEAAGAALLIIQMDTPGGLASSMRTMVSHDHGLRPYRGYGARHQHRCRTPRYSRR